ncbi:MAG: flagellar assembly protein FliW [Polyangiaceae bacterium]
MRIDTDRFGTIELKTSEVINFPAGVIGFPTDKNFALIRHGNSECIGWLQSLDNGALALPVVSAHGLTPDYPDVPITDAAREAGIAESDNELAVLAVLCAPRGQPATVNLMAPIVVNSTTRQGAQIALDGTRFSTRELFLLSHGASGDTTTPRSQDAKTAGPAIPPAE